MKILIETEKITVFQSEIYKTTSTVIQTNDCVIVVDPTWLPSDIEAIKQYVHKIVGNKPLYLLFTHSDFDHVLGYGAFPNAIAIGSEELLKFSKSPDKVQHVLDEIETFDHQYYLDRPYKVRFPKLDIVIYTDEETIQIGEMKLTFYIAKGHTADGLMMVVDSLGVLIAGDYLSDEEFPFVYDSSSNYEETMNKIPAIMEKHQIQLLVPGHGNPTHCHDEIMDRQKKTLYYIAELRNYINLNQIEDSLGLINGYKYTRGLKDCHEANIEIIKKELAK